MCMPPMVMMAVTTGVQAAAAIGQGYMQSQALKGQARQAEFSAKTERIKGMVRDNQIERESLRQASSNLAHMAWSGLAIGSGSFQAIRNANADAARRDRGVNQFNADMSVAQRRMQAAQLRQSAGIALTSGFLKAGMQVASNANAAFGPGSS